MKDCDEMILRGSPISKGIGIGLPAFFPQFEANIAVDFLSATEVEEEVIRYRQALELSRKDLQNLQKKSYEKGAGEVGAILATHLEMMQDPLIEIEIEDRIRNTKLSTQVIFHHLLEEYKQRFATIDDSYFQERIKDIEDISRRILGHLKPLQKPQIAEMPPNCVVVAYELVPSETIEADSSQVSAFLTETGGLTSHAAIIARAKGIPYVANIDMQFLQSLSPSTLIVDGGQGLIIVNPKKSTLNKYQKLKKDQIDALSLLEKTSHLKAETIDGFEVRIFANLENPNDVSPIIKNGASGIGLFRTEYLCLTKKGFPTEEEQFDTYKHLARVLKGKPLVIRIYDLGGDKKFDTAGYPIEDTKVSDLAHELNPALGCRAIRFLMRHPDLLDAQLRAILKASRFGDIHILIPMVSDVSELRFVRKRIEYLRNELMKEGYKVSHSIPLGCMIEVPSSALMSDVIARESDFLSIGTNDLVQYTLAADRSNPYTSDLYYSAHPGVLRLIKQVVSHAKACKKPVIVCGEMAADPAMIPVLIGFGISDFSVSARHIPLVKSTVRKSRLLVSAKVAEKAVKFSSSEELKDFLVEESLSL